MKQRTADMSPAVIVVTWMYLFITAGCFVIGFFHPLALLTAALLALIAVVCFLTAPIAYELAGDRLTVFTRLGSREFLPIIKCEPVTRTLWLGIRLFGNGGVFAGT